MTKGWSHTLFWLGIGAVFLLGLHLLSAILLPFALGTAIAFVLNPLVERLIRWKIPRTAATLLVLAGFALAIAVFGLLLVPLIETQVEQLVHRFPGYLASAESQIERQFGRLQTELSADDMQRLRDAIGNKLGELAGGLDQVAGRVLTGGKAVANLLSLLFVAPIVTFFLLRDWTRILGAIDGWMPRRHIGTIREQARLINETLSGFIRGQVAVCLLMGCFYALGLSVLGLESGTVIGLCVGMLIFIPFLGGLSGGVIATLLAIAQFGLWQKPICVVVLFAIGQALEGNVITPKLVGDRVHLHPLWIIFSLFAFGELFGFLGVLIAVPMAAILGVLVRFALQRYLASPLYRPEPPADAAA